MRGTVESLGIPEEAEDVLRFWFPEHLRDDHATMVSQFEWWFRGGADSAIIERFQLLLEPAARGERDHWSHTPRSRLALIIVLDQFSRRLSRYGAGVRAGSEGACSGARGNRVRSLRRPRHAVAENVLLPAVGPLRGARASGTAVRLAEELVGQAPAELRRVLEHSAARARGHRDVIARFGRHPHRNAVLGRQSTPEELDYLAGGQVVHTRLPPR
jgi:uncharacterized protein (DUF924 family)